MGKNTIKVRNVRRVYVENGDDLTIAEAANKLNISAPACQAMYGRGVETFAEMVEYRAKIDAGDYHGGGRTATTYFTSKGELTLTECAKLHKYGLSKCAIRARGLRWGFDHKCLWIESGVGFNARSIELDGQPRGEDVTLVPQGANKKDITVKNVNRLRACLRDKGREKCIHYNDRISGEGEFPKECSVACGDVCSNYKGATVEVKLDSSGRPPRKYNPNGTATMYS